MARRTRRDIARDILRISTEGARKTHIVYRANLNFNIVKTYLTKLIEKGFLRQEGKVFITTEDGLKQIDALNSVSL